MIVRMESEKNILSEWGQFLRYISKTEGAGPQADLAGLESLKRQVEKELWEAASEKDEKLLKRMREHIEKMIEKIMEVTNIKPESIK